jgi:arylsulfatase A-like enzyme
MRKETVFVLGLLLLPMTSLRATSEQETKPNIVVFLVDDMGPMDTSVPMLTDEHGKPQRHPLNQWYRTPNMERLATQGVRFSNFYAHNVCSPSRVSIMTGQNSARHRTTDYIHAYGRNGGPNMPPQWNWEGLRKRDVTLATILAQNGFKTIHIGKAHFAPDKHEGTDPRNLGFDVNIGGCAIGRPDSYYGQEGYGKGTEVAVPHLEKYHGSDTFLTEALTLEAKAEVDKAVAAKEPFFLYMSHYAVHSPFNSDPRFAGHYGGKSEGQHAYATLIEGMDKSLGDLIDHFQAKGIAENTLILFLGDNGGDCPGGSDDISSNAPLRGRKGSKWEGGVRVPFIAAWAKPDPENPWQKKLPIVPGGIRAETGTCSDLFPTIVDLVDALVPADHPVDGQSLKRLLTGQLDPEHRNEFLNHYPHPRRGQSHYFTTWRKGDWKVRYDYLAKGDNRYGLYELSKDPTESKNLAKESPEQLRSMMQEMVRQLESMDALYPVKDGQTLEPIIP